MAVGSFLCDQIAILLHKYSFMTLTYQVEDEFSFLDGSMVHNVDLNWIKRLNHTQPPSPMSPGDTCLSVCLYIYV